VRQELEEIAPREHAERLATLDHQERRSALERLERDLDRRIGAPITSATSACSASGSRKIRSRSAFSRIDPTNPEMSVGSPCWPTPSPPEDSRTTGACEIENSCSTSIA
jgi:hypothetical protein